MDQYFEANAVLSVFSKRYMELKKGLPIRLSEMGVLNIITHTPGPHSSVMLAELTGVSKPMITAHITSLAEKGYAVKEQSKEDKRVYYIFPTDKALELVDSARKEMDSHLSWLMEVLGQEDFDALIRLAKKAGEVLREQREQQIDQ